MVEMINFDRSIRRSLLKSNSTGLP